MLLCACPPFIRSTNILLSKKSSESPTAVVEEYRDWENLPKKRRYPPQGFFMDLKQTLEGEGVTPNFSLIDAVQPILELRGEEL